MAALSLPEIEAHLPIAFRKHPDLHDIQRLQVTLEHYPQEELEPAHYFAHGMYARELFMPKGVLIVGRIHRHQHLVIQVSGDVLVYSEQWGKRRLTGYQTMVSDAATKRVLYPFEDTRWLTLHLNPSNERDIETIEDELIVPDDPEVMKALRDEVMAQIAEEPTCHLLP